MRTLVMLAVWLFASTLVWPAAKAAERRAVDPVAQRATMRLYDPEVGVATRRAILAGLEAEAAVDPDPGRLYALGSLYRRGDSARERAFEKDLDKAREYLSRAALDGYLQAMAKLSVLEVEAKNRFEANVWAQLYHHYRKDSPDARERWSDGFAASLIARASRGFDEKRLSELNDSVGMMITSYDARIRAGIARQSAAQAEAGVQPARTGPRALPDASGRRPEAGIAEYYVAFDAKGEVERIWLLDAWPDPAIARVLRPVAMAHRVIADDGVDPQDVLALLPLEYNDLRHQIRKQD